MSHRIKNQLQMLAVAARTIAARPGASPVEIGREVGARLVAIAGVHDCLYGSHAGSVSALDLLTKVCAPMQGLGAAIEVVCDGALELQPDQLAPAAMIVSEAVCNSIKHAFPDGRGGIVTVDLRTRPPGMALTISDDGVGMPEAEGQTRLSGLGLIDALARQLHGEAHLARSDAGACVTVSFPTSS